MTLTALSRSRLLTSISSLRLLLCVTLISNPLQVPSVAETATAWTFPRNTSVTMRAWTCHGRTQQEMVNKLAQAGIIKSPVVRDCMNKVDRANYVLHKAGAYDDAPQGIGYGMTISAPHMHAHVLEDLLPALSRAAATYSKAGEGKEISILDVGCGSGYLTACLGRLVDKGTESNSLGIRGKVYGIDFVPELVSFSKENIKREDQDLINSDTVELQVGDGWKGLPAAAPFDAIHVGAAADTFPRNLMMQLAIGGTLICPVGPDGGFQNLYKIDRVKESPEFNEADYSIKQLIGVRYVPLVHLD